LVVSVGNDDDGATVCRRNPKELQVKRRGQPHVPAAASPSSGDQT